MPPLDLSLYLAASSNLNGLISYRLQGQALIVTGFAVAGIQIMTSLAQFVGNVFGVVPGWLASCRERSFWHEISADHRHLDHYCDCSNC